MTRRLFALILIANLLLAGCAWPKTQAAVYPGAEWTWASSPESLGWCSNKLAVARAYSERIGSAAVMIVDHGVVVDGWGDLAYNYHCHSMRKSLISALYGIYAADGKIDLTRTLVDLGIDDITPLTDAEKTATVADLLSARSGVYLPAAGSTAEMIAQRPERGSHAPGTFWYYNNWDFNTLGTIFDQLSGEADIYTAFDKRIADPIGMQDYDPADAELKYSYEPYSRHPYYYFHMSTRDLARFGLLYLHNGRWGEQQVIPANWVRQSTASHSTIAPQSGYGYLWWTGEGAGGFPNVDEGSGTYWASGFGGHRVIVMPARNLVVVHRTHTELGQEIPEWEIGTLLWLILDAAGEKKIGDPVQIERATGTRLTGEQLLQDLPGSSLITSVSGTEITLSYGTDGEVTLSQNGTKMTEGHWWVEGDTYCHGLGTESSGGDCFQVLRKGDQIRIFDLEGYATLQFETVQQEE